MSKRHLVRFFLAGLSALLYSKPQVTYCQEDSDKVPLAYILLDASNSMWTRMDNKPKIEIAKEVLSDLIKSLPERINTGLTAFGHRSENDCADIQDLSAIGVMDKNEIERRIQKISPKGKSSLGAAIRHVVEKIRDYDGPKTIILISDGIEDCDFDACTAVQELKEKDSGFKIEVIGLDVESTAASQLACIARESGGGYQHVTRSAQIADTQESLNRNALGQSPAYQGQEYPLRADPLSDKSLAISRGIPTPFMPAVQRGRGKIRFQRENWLLRPF